MKTPHVITGTVPRSNFEIGGGGGEDTISASILGGGGTKHFYLLILYNSKNIGGARAPCPPLLCGPGINASTPPHYELRVDILVTFSCLANITVKFRIIKNVEPGASTGS